MDVFMARLTVYFEGPFWVGLYERDGPEGYQVCKITFGREPRDAEVFAYLAAHWQELRFSPALPGGAGEARRPNPKRARREAARAAQAAGPGTKAQRSIQLQREQMKTQRRTAARSRRAAEEARKLALRREKRKEKHKGH